ncbi:hypothetical protein K490DRAFT_58418 [Saccharata proteae CBS 121410]|uniref:Uncharacterized protein n=1 Tax=Saccharata proteae CBS 121410 TaxID=1314787 RepID=A0A9P4HUD7_9PEZI|nr:hypothetical protein K490DRAFT_58418 [Saccharata proteae CBS 121410]
MPLKKSPPMPSDLTDTPLHIALEPLPAAPSISDSLSPPPSPPSIPLRPLPAATATPPKPARTISGASGRSARSARSANLRVRFEEPANSPSRDRQRSRSRSLSAAGTGTTRSEETAAAAAAIAARPVPVRRVVSVRRPVVPVRRRTLKPGETRLVPRDAHLQDAWQAFACGAATHLPPVWSAQHDHVLASLDASTWIDPVDMIAYLKEEFPELEGHSLAQAAVVARLGVLERIPGVGYWKSPLQVPTPREFARILREKKKLKFVNGRESKGKGKRVSVDEDDDFNLD